MSATEPAWQREANATKRPSVRVATFDDYHGIAAIEAANGLSPKPRSQWLHLWMGNPAYKRNPDWPIGWVIENEGGAIAGTMCNIPFTYHLAGKQYVAASGRGWAVDPRYRGFSMLLLARQTRRRAVDFYLTNTPSPTAAALYSRCGWLNAPAGEWDRTAFWVTSYRGLVRNYLAEIMRRPIQSSSLISRKLVRSTRTPVHFEWCTQFDSRFDEFWVELLSRNPSRFIADRTRETLEWHFKYALQQNRVWILAAVKGSRLIAYAIFERKNTQFLGLARALLIDFQAIERAEDLCADALSYALDRCRQERIDLLENPGCWIERPGLLGRRAPYHRALKYWSYLYSAPNEALQRALRVADSWHPTHYDGDASL